MTCSIQYAGGVRVSSTQLMRAFDELGISTPPQLINIVLNGISYANEDFDVLQHCVRSLEKVRSDAVRWVAGLS